MLSNGLAVRRFTVPPMLPSSAEASEDLSTSAPEITSEGSTSNARSRASSSVARMRLFRVTMLYCGPKPRTVTFCPSPPVVRVMVMPGRCSRESATSASGNRPSSSALMESSTTVAFFLMSRDFSRLARKPGDDDLLERRPLGVFGGSRAAAQSTVSAAGSMRRRRRRRREWQPNRNQSRLRLGTLRLPVPFKDVLLIHRSDIKTKENENSIPHLLSYSCV